MAPRLSQPTGIAFGSATINILTLLGIGLLLSQTAWAMSVLRVIGAGYLLYLAYGAFRKMVNPPELDPIRTKPKPVWNLFATGYLLQVTNPKAIAFWLAIASVGAVEGAPMPVVLAFVFGAFLLSFSCHGAWALAMSAAPIRTAYAASRRWIEAALGMFFTFAAFKLATSET